MGEGARLHTRQAAASVLVKAGQGGTDAASEFSTPLDRSEQRVLSGYNRIQAKQVDAPPLLQSAGATDSEQLQRDRDPSARYFPLHAWIFPLRTSSMDFIIQKTCS